MLLPVPEAVRFSGAPSNLFRLISYVLLSPGKIQHPFMIKVLERSGIQSPYLNMIKAIYSKPVANFKVNGEKLERTQMPLNRGMESRT